MTRKEHLLLLTLTLMKATAARSRRSIVLVTTLLTGTAVALSPQIGIARPSSHTASRKAHARAHAANVQARARAHAANTKARSAKVQAQNKALASGNVIQAASAFRGTRYVMGGTSRAGFDCSGFVRYILSNTGKVALPRTATEQFYRGAPIANADLQPGDLVFFQGTYKRGISHVGIYCGGGKFIHAANAHKGVRTDNLNDSYYRAHYAGARRVLPEQMRQAAAIH